VKIREKKKVHLHTNILMLAICRAMREYSDPHEKSPTSPNRLSLHLFFYFRLLIDLK
jgi:hypothetical protein